MNTIISKIKISVVGVFSFLLPRSSFLVILSSFLVISCSDDSYQSRLRELILEDMKFSCDAGTQEQVFRHEDLSAYTVTSKTAWCTPRLDVNNYKLVVSVTANDTYDARTDTVTLTDINSKATRYITVTQARRTGLVIDQTYFEVSMYGDTVTTNLKSNVNYEVLIPEGCDWVTKADDISKTRGLDTTAITFYVKENQTYRARDAVISVVSRDEGLTDKLTIHQPFNTVFKVDSTAFNVNMEGGDFTVNVESNIPYDIIIPDTCKWITQSDAAKTRAVESKVLTFSVKENKGYHDRDGVIILSNDKAGIALPINVHQPFTAVFKPDKKAFDVAMEGGTVTINMESNVTYDVKIPDGCDWITRTSNSRTRGVVTSAIELKVAENTSYHDREAVVVISNTEAGVSESITITQPFNTVFSVDQTAIDVAMDGGTVTVNLQHNISYEVSIPDGCDWITLPATSRGKSRAKTRGKTRAATETTPITLRVKENTSYKDREAIITISNKEASAEVKVNVHQPFTTVFKADNTAFDVDMAGGTVTVNMESNISFDVKIPDGCDWITMPTASKTRSTKTTAVVFRVSENTTYKDREAVITISNKEANASIGIYIHQPFTTTFNVDKAEAEVPMEGGTVIANVESNISYEVKIPSDCDWISLESGSRTRAAKTSVVMFRVAANTSGRDRSAIVTIGNSTVGVSAALTIKQPFTSNFNVDSTPIEIDERGGTIGVNVAANVDVSVQPQADWLSVGKKTDVGDGYWTQQIVVSAFTDKTAQRTGNVKFLYGAANQSVVVTVTQNRTLFISESSIALTEAGQTQTLTLTNTQSRSVVWTSSDTKVATVSSSGIVTPVANGKAVITVKSADGKYSDTVNVTVDLPPVPDPEPEPEPEEDTASPSADETSGKLTR